MVSYQKSRVVSILKKKIVSMLILFGLFTSVVNIANAKEAMNQVGRYLTVEVKPKSEQLDLLSQTVQVRFPQEVLTVGDAMKYLLRFSGYDLVAPAVMDATLKTTLTKPLPVIDRELGPVTLKMGLIVLVGQAFYLTQDPINRVVNFHLRG